MKTTQLHDSPLLDELGSSTVLEPRLPRELHRIGSLAIAPGLLLFAIGCGASSEPIASRIGSSSVPSGQAADPSSGRQSPGSTASVPETLPPQSLSPTTATAITGQTVAFTAPFGGAPLAWMVNGVAGGNSASGTIDAAGNYTAPLFPTSVPVIVSAQLVLAQGSTPLVAQGSVQIVNPSPQLAQIAPSAISTGNLPPLTLTGSGFNSESTVVVNGQAVRTTFVDATHVSAQLPQSANAASSVTVAVTNAAPGGGTTSAITLPVLFTGIPAATTHPLVARLSAYLPAGASIFAEFGPDTTYGRKTWTQSAPSSSRPATLLVAGMRASSTYHMRLHFILHDSTELLGEDETFITGAVPPARVPPITVTQTPGMTPSPGIEMMDFTGGTRQQLLAAAVDLSGNLIWYYDYNVSDGSPEAIKLLPSGNIGVIISPGSYREIDLTGNIVREVTLSQLNAQLAAAGSTVTLAAIHHDFAVLPNGILVLLTDAFKSFNDLSGLPGTTSLLGDLLIALDPSFNIVWTWSTFDHLDPNRIPWVVLLTSTPVPTYDWTHSNAVIYSQSDRSLLLSSRVQSWVMKIDFNDGLGSGDLLWRLGQGGDFTLVGGTDPIDWFYNQHFPAFVDNSGPVFDLSLFDNGDVRQLDNSGTLCGTTVPCYSRPVIMTIDENSKTATLNWTPRTIYSYWGGVSEMLAPDRLEYTLSNDPTTGGARVVETSIEAVPIDVLRMETAQPCYRAIRLPSLYVGVNW